MAGICADPCSPSRGSASRRPARPSGSIGRPAGGSPTSFPPRQAGSPAITVCMNGSAVPITRSAEPAMALFADPAEMPPDCDALFAAGASDGLFGSRAWYRNVVRHGLAAGKTACFAVWREAGRALAIFPMQRDADGTARSLTTPYTCLYSPLLAPDLDRAAILRAGLAFGRFCRPGASVRLDALAPEWRGLDPLLEGVRRAGLVVQRFDHFGNWHEPVAGRGWKAYLDSRPGALRETVRRKLGRAERDPDTRVEIIDGTDDLEDGIAAFESVYRRSGKEPEPFPEFNAGLMRQTAPIGLLRLGVLWIGEAPVAVQLWIVDNG